MQIVIAEAEGCHAAGFEVLDDDLAFGGKLAGDLLPGGGFQVKGKAALIAVDAEIVGAAACFIEGWPPLTGFIAVETFDFDHVRAEIGEDHGAERPRQHAREIEDADTI